MRLKICPKPFGADSLAPEPGERRFSTHWRHSADKPPSQTFIALWSPAGRLPTNSGETRFARRLGSISSAWTRSDGPCLRSEEHTSELQSLMRISYAVFCLKKNRQHT